MGGIPSDPGQAYLVADTNENHKKNVAIYHRRVVVKHMTALTSPYHAVKPTYPEQAVSCIWPELAAR